MTIDRRPGMARELFIYVLTQKVGRTWRRKLAGNFTVPCPYANLLAQWPPGRYRLEWRDSNRWVCRVEGWNVSPNRVVQRINGRRQGRRGPRKVGVPVTVPMPAPPPGTGRQPTGAARRPGSRGPSGR